MGLWVRGKLPEKGCHTAAIVGARDHTEYGRAMAEWFGRELSAAGIWVVSGMARGIDSPDCSRYRGRRKVPDLLHG